MGNLTGRETKIVTAVVEETARQLGRALSDGERASITSACVVAAKKVVFEPDPIPPAPRPTSASGVAGGGDGDE